MKVSIRKRIFQEEPVVYGVSMPYPQLNQQSILFGSYRLLKKVKESLNTECIYRDISASQRSCQTFQWILLRKLKNSESDLFNPNITFCISLNKYIKLINSFGFGRHLLKQDIGTGTDATLGCFKQNSLNIHIIWYV